MRYVWLGDSPESREFVRASGAASGVLVAACVPESSVAAALALAPGVRIVRQPAELLSLPDIAAVLLATADPAAIEVARQFAAQGVLMLVDPQLAHGTELVYQLGLLQDENPQLVRVIPLCPWRVHPLFQALRAQASATGAAGVVHWEFERSFPPTGLATGPQTLTRAQLEQAWLGDLDLLSAVAGEFQYVTAVPVGDSPEAPLSCTLNCGGQQAVATTWSGRVSPASQLADDVLPWRLRGTSADRVWELGGGSQGQAWVLTVRQGEQLARSVQAQASGPGYWAQVQQLTAGSTSTTVPGLNDLQRVFDLLDAVQRSLKRRRTIDVYREAPSERSTFKSQMTAMGCGVLMLTLVTMLMGLGVGLVAKELELPGWIMQGVRALVFLPVFLFLALQVLIFLTRPPVRSGQGPAGGTVVDHDDAESESAGLV